ncbi:hypothetical protein LWI29_017913 [Acer saccharum]|uniref:Uncharacterized protein n=1 Tax=Acer saccharum TaxID=4024 RepID=A0AA39VT70_ACESA|nr:hypothetical protein LWI29_017913 [Acer saccharum]
MEDRAIVEATWLEELLGLKKTSSQVGLNSLLEMETCNNGSKKEEGEMSSFCSCKMKRDKKGGEGRRQPNHVVNETKKAPWLQMIQKNRMDSEVGNYVTDNQFHSKPTCETICKSPLDKESISKNHLAYDIEDIPDEFATEASAKLVFLFVDFVELVFLSLRIASSLFDV